MQRPLKNQTIPSLHGLTTEHASPKITSDQYISENVLNIRKMKIKIALRGHLTPVRMIIIKKTNSACWQRYGERLILVPRW